MKLRAGALLPSMGRYGPVQDFEISSPQTRYRVAPTTMFATIAVR
jgi:hypothetical protein